jgi:hypothetical protein
VTEDLDGVEGHPAADASENRREPPYPTAVAEREQGGGGEQHDETEPEPPDCPAEIVHFREEFGQPENNGRYESGSDPRDRPIEKPERDRDETEPRQ